MNVYDAVLMTNNDRRQQKMMTTYDAAEFLGLSVSRVCQMALRGDVPAKKVHAKWMFNEEDLTPYRDSRETVGQNRRSRLRGPATYLCDAGTVPGLANILAELDMDVDEFAFSSGLKDATVHEAINGAWIKAKDRERILETVVMLKRQKRQSEADAIGEAMV